MIIERNRDKVVFRLSAKISVDDLQDMADLFEFKEIAKRSKASQKEVDLLVKAIRKGRWENWIAHIRLLVTIKRISIMNKTLTIILTLFTVSAFGQKNPTEEAQPIVAEGKLLCRSEMASWYGTDIFLENYKDRDNIGGYFSYSENDITKCIFFSKSESPKVIGTISFDSSYNVNASRADLSQRDFTTNENDIYVIRKIALAEMNSDTLFRTYENTNLNLIPLINGDEKKVYVLTGPKQNGVVIFGNDYLLTFDKNNKLTLKKQLHKNIIPINYGGKGEEGKQIEGTIHSHLPETGDFITSTDICTLMLYERFAKWGTHNVVSKKYLNIWNCKTDQLTVISMGAIDKINKDQEKRNKKKNKDK
jgi:hypothetical protein